MQSALKRAGLPVHKEEAQLAKAIGQLAIAQSQILVEFNAPPLTNNATCVDNEPTHQRHRTVRAHAFP